MNPRMIAFLFVLTCLVAAAQMSDHQGCKDPALFTRMPHYFLPAEDSVVDTPFDGVEFMVKQGTQRVEGHHLMDIAPTLLDRFGLPIPPEMQGKVI